MDHPIQSACELDHDPDTEHVTDQDRAQVNSHFEQVLAQRYDRRTIMAGTTGLALTSFIASPLARRQRRVVSAEHG